MPGEATITFPTGIPVGISQCLMGVEVRYDGSHKHSSYCTKTLSAWFDFVPVCPEMGIGMGSPREAIHLQGKTDSDEIRAVGNRSKELDGFTSIVRAAFRLLHR